MKRRLLMASMAMVAALASCSKDVTTTPDDVNATKDTAYAKVNITMGTSTRATAGTPEFEAGTKEEGKVNSILLVVYDENGNAIGFGSTTNSTEAAGTGTNNVSDEYDQVVELSLTEDKANAHSVVAYINTSDAPITNLTEALEQTTKTYGEIGVGKSGFFMTNAGYYKGNDWVVAADITGKLYGTKEAAEAEDAETTTIYVERLAAKVTVDVKSDVKTDADYIIVGTDGTTVYTLEFDAVNAKWAPTGTAQEMFVLKNYWNDASLNSWANAADKFRSFWAAGVYYAEDYISEDGKKLQQNLDYVSSNDLRRTTDSKGNAMKGIAYAPEHTYGNTVVTDDDYNVLGAATSVIVLGQYTVKNNGTEATKFKKEGKTDFFLLHQATNDGTTKYMIFTEGELMAYLLDAEKLELYNDSYALITADNATESFKLKWDNKKYSLELKDARTKVYTADEEQEESYDEYLGSFTAATNARHYNEGYAYFYAPIEHMATSGVGQYGVVRNHSYKLTISEITSLGAPLDDDHFGTDPDKDPDPDDPGEQPIIPDPNEVAVIKVDLKVLSWHVLEQDVKF